MNECYLNGSDQKHTLSPPLSICHSSKWNDTNSIYHIRLFKRNQGHIHGHMKVLFCIMRMEQVASCKEIMKTMCKKYMRKQERMEVNKCMCSRDMMV